MGAVKQELLGIADAFGDAGHDLVATPEEASQIVESVTDALQRLRRLIRPSTPSTGDEMTVGTLIESLKQFDPAATVWLPELNENILPLSKVKGVRATEPTDWSNDWIGSNPIPSTFDTGVILEY